MPLLTEPPIMGLKAICGVPIVVIKLRLSPGDGNCPRKHFLSFIYLFYLYVHTMFGSFLPPSPTPSLTSLSTLPLPPTPSLPGRNYFALISNFVEERV
jgi:hypothetical protein